MTDRRDLIQRLATELDRYTQMLEDDRFRKHPLATKARAYLAQPEPEGPTPAQLLEMWTEQFEGDERMTFAEFWDATCAVLARYGHQRPTPIPLAERQPTEADCDADGRCWLCGKVEGDWRLINPAKSGVPKLTYCFSHWLPHWALPVPEVQP